MNFECTFLSAKGREFVVPVHLSPEEVEKSAGAELALHAYALRHAYREVPAGSQHVRDGVRAVKPN